MCLSKSPHSIGCSPQAGQNWSLSPSKQNPKKFEASPSQLDGSRTLLLRKGPGFGGFQGLQRPAERNSLLPDLSKEVSRI